MPMKKYNFQISCMSWWVSLWFGWSCHCVNSFLSNKKIDKYLKKLDQELHKFKLELEADHAGITSKLEKVISVQANENSDLFNEETFNNLVDDKTYTFSDINSQLVDTYANLYSPSNSIEQSALQFNMPNNYYMNNNSTQLMNMPTTPSSLTNIFRMSSFKNN